MPRPRLKNALVISVAIVLASCGGDAANSAGTSPATMTKLQLPVASVAGRALTQDDAQIGTCVNMANHLEPPNEGDWGRAINKRDFAEIAAKGFRVRTY
jgi:endoglucanase